MTDVPDPRDFVSRQGTQLMLLDVPFHRTGFNIEWLGLRSDHGDGSDTRYPTKYEIRDSMETVDALTGGVVRSDTLGVSVGCRMCIEPSLGQFNEAALRQVDLVLKEAADQGLKLIIPLAGRGTDCAHVHADDRYYGSACAFVRWRGLPADGAFFADAQVRADFKTYVATLLNRVNTLTGIAYKDDPTILAWEDCDACATLADEGAASAWVADIGQFIKTLDQHHLVESGAFAGRLSAASPAPVKPASFAPAGVDIIGDDLMPYDDDVWTASGRKHLTTPQDVTVDAAAAAATGRAYLIDAYGWGRYDWPKPADFQAFLDAMLHSPDLSSALLWNLQGHADNGGYLPVPNMRPAPADPAAHIHSDAASAFYFPGIAAGWHSADDMQARARQVRQFDYRFIGVSLLPAFLITPPPEIIRVKDNKVAWRGAAGSVAYSIERSANPLTPNSWQTVCDRCKTDENEPWTDPAPTGGKVWYRVIGYNLNDHAGLPSDPATATP